MPSLRARSSPLLVLVALSAACASSQTNAAPPPERGASVTASDDPAEPIERTLQRKVSGLRVTRTPGGTLAFQLRGSSSYQNRDTPPLFLLNGSPYKAGPGGELVGIDPNEIDTVKVLTPAESGMYGSEGANGVIIITTKRGKRAP